MMNGDKLPMFLIFTFFHFPSTGWLILFALTAAVSSRPVLAHDFLHQE